MSTETAVLAAPGKGLWSASILLACVLGWVGYSFPPMTWRIPEDMVNIGALSPPADQARLAAVVNANLWKNTLLKFTLAGLGMGAAGLVIASRNFGRQWLSALAALASGIVGGALSGTIGLVVRQYLDREYPIPFISYESRPLFCDSVVFAVVSTFLLLPLATLLYTRLEKAERGRAFLVVLAGILTGLLVPFLSAMLLPASTTTSFFPPTGIALTSLWFTTLALTTVALCVLRGSHSPKPSAAAELGAA